MERVESYGAKKIDAANCLEAIVGRGEIRKIDAEAKTFFLTAGSVNKGKTYSPSGKRISILISARNLDHLFDLVICL
jgi:hypothetical protein